MNRTTHHTPRIRKDVAKELNDDVLALSVNARVPGALELALKESARRDQADANPGAAIAAIFDRWVRSQGCDPANVSPALRNALICLLLGGEKIEELPIWIDVAKLCGPRFENAAAAVAIFERVEIKRAAHAE